MKAIIAEIGRVRAAAGGGMGASASNGVAARAIQSVVGQVRVPKDALEERLSTKLEAKHPVMPWLVEWAAMVLNRLHAVREKQG